MRDPRLDPRPGDVLRIAHAYIVKEYAVAHAFPNGLIVVAVTDTYPNHPDWTPDHDALIWIREQWTRRFRGAEVVRAAVVEP